VERDDQEGGGDLVVAVTITLFNNKGGVGKTTLAYHLAHMLARIGVPTIAADLDPQANLTSAFFDETTLERLWAEGEGTMLSAVKPVMRGLGDITEVSPTAVADQLWILPGELGLSRFEDDLSQAWPQSVLGKERELRSTSAFHRVMRAAAAQVGASVVIIDVGPNLGAINRAALLASDHLVVPLAADLFSLQGLQNLGPTLTQWRSDWQDNALPRAPDGLDIPSGQMNPLGYVVLQHAMRLDRPVKAYEPWLRRIRPEFHLSVLGEKADPARVDYAEDPYALASLRNYRSLMPLAQDARKPMFDLRAADGALGSMGRLVQICYDEFFGLAEKIVGVADLPWRMSVA
jgi:chromosome partitioning protein